MVEFERKQLSLMVYTRTVLPEEYPDGLARSVHIALSRDGWNYTPWNKNYGILFAEAKVLGNNTLCPRGVKNPWIFQNHNGEYGIAAIRVLEDGSPEHTKGADILLWHTSDFITFNKQAVFYVDAQNPVEEFRCRYCTEKSYYQLCWRDCTGRWYRTEKQMFSNESTVRGELFEKEGKKTNETNRVLGAEQGSVVNVSEETVIGAALRWSPVFHARTEVPKCVKIRNPEELMDIMATAVYSDGSAAQKKVRWNLQQVDFEKKGSYTVEGELWEESFHFPLAVGYGDPVIFPWKGNWYFIGTNDNMDDVAFYVRKASTVQGLFAEGIRQQIILDKDEQKNFIQTFWAPEFHVIGGELYLLFAVSGKVWGPQCYLMKLKQDGEIINPEDWEEPVRIRKKDGRWLSDDGITLDMTYLKAGGKSYVVWSYRENIGTELDTGSMLYIAEIDEKTPWQLKSDPVLFSRPLYGWENVSGTINNEGPHGFVKNGKVYLGYSGGSANSYTYAVGLLTADEDADLLDPENWEKANTPVLSFYSVKGEYGPGHHSFYVSERGELMIAYHAEDAVDHVIRCDGIRRIHFDVSGRPRFDQSASESLDPSLGKIKMQVEIL